jgi:hypothetical protein
VKNDGGVATDKPHKKLNAWKLSMDLVIDE